MGNIMIDIIAYITGYVLASKLLECRRDKFINTCIGTETNSTKTTALEPVSLKKHHTLKQPHIIK
jgi:hypothetical protein